MLQIAPNKSPENILDIIFVMVPPRSHCSESLNAIGYFPLEQPPREHAGDSLGSRPNERP